MTVISRENKLCPMCMEVHSVLTVKAQENTFFKGIPVSYDAVYEYCENTDEYSQTEEMMTANDISMKDVYRLKVGLMSSSQIKAIRHKYGISQPDLSIILGWGGRTITRYESHQVQDAAHDAILRKLDEDPEWYLSFLQNAFDKISPSAYEKYRSRALALFGARKEEYLLKSIEAWCIDSEENSGTESDSGALIQRAVADMIAEAGKVVAREAKQIK